MWRRAPVSASGGTVTYLPFRQPYVPDLGGRLDWLRARTRLVVLGDGYPGRLANGGVVVHPLDGRYLLEALLAQQADHPRRRLHGAIARTAAAIIGRAEARGEALVFRYVDTASSMAEGRPHISGMAQAYYAAVLAKAGQLLGDAEILDAADRFFAPLLIPVAEGGALYPARSGAALAVVPTRPRDLILNGWLSILVSVHAYAQLRSAPAARELFAANLVALRRLLPLYDVPELRLTRYGLTGPLRLRLSFDATERVTLSRPRIAIPGEGETPIPPVPGGRWTQRLFPEDLDLSEGAAHRGGLAVRGRVVRMNVILSRAPYPRPNELRFGVRGDAPARVVLEAHIGRYDPMTSATVEREWVTLAERRLDPGAQAITMPLPYEPIDLFAYPTNFARGGPGELVNTYHGTHIVRLRQLAGMTGDRTFADWADRWRRYVDDWQHQPGLEKAICRSPEGPLL